MTIMIENKPKFKEGKKVYYLQGRGIFEAVVKRIKETDDSNRFHYAFSSPDEADDNHITQWFYEWELYPSFKKAKQALVSIVKNIDRPFNAK
jgi:hypothetical protein